MSLKVESVSCSFSGLNVLSDINLELENKGFLVVLGPSGCGKSTLLKLISGLITPNRGKIVLDGEDITGKPGMVSYMHQEDLLLPWLNILDNAALPLFIRGEKKTSARQKARELLADFGLAGFEQYYPGQLSGGMRQRVSLLRSYLYRNDILLLDEPFGALDAITREKMQDWLLDVFSSLSAAVLLVTHDVDEAILLADKIIVLSPRPARIREVFDVPFGRPRSRDVLLSSEYLKLKRSLWASLTH
ncbi:ABC transporter ATP-binding protein [Spirochaetia bacterium 38H-sp]|uniref:ABC transporter ATP-binding protein n=1 Tax=Rarispira pelagica TaxID=3141764 RepID=A0ABU9UEB5_9SPIR